MNIYEKILTEEKLNLSNRRFEHVESVIRTAQRLAKLYCVDYNQVTMSALFHDYCKDWTLAELNDYIEQNKLILNEKIDEVLHGIIASDLIKKLYPNQTSFNIIEAIKFHTTLVRNASDITKIVFIADYIEPIRIGDHFDIIREQVGILDLNNLCYLILNQINNYLNLNNFEVSLYSKEVLVGGI